MATDARHPDVRSILTYCLWPQTRGTLYAGYHYLHVLGVRFLAVNATIVPVCPASLPVLRDVLLPAFEYRAVNSWAALEDPLHAQRSHLNDGSHLSAARSDTAAAVSTAGRAPHSPGSTPYVRCSEPVLDVSSPLIPRTARPVYRYNSLLSLVADR